MKLRTVRDVELKNKQVVMRVDFNVSLNKQHKIGNDLRIQQSIGTIKYLLDQNCRVILISHLGSPGGKMVRELSLKPLVKRLEKLLEKRVSFLNQKIGSDELLRVIKTSRKVCLLENLRFYEGEEKNERRFGQELAELGEVYVNDAFGVCHRDHASVTGLGKFLDSVAGLGLAREVEVILGAVNQPKRPLTVIVGGAKIKSKIKSVDELLGKADNLVFGGAVANTLLLAKGFEVGRSWVEKDMVNELRVWLKKAEGSQTKIWLPKDAEIGELSTGKYGGVVKMGEKINEQILDIGPETVAVYKKVIARARTVIWNGPMGVYENKLFGRGTEAVYKAVAKNRDSLSIAGGGETLSALNNTDYLKTIDLVSTGGGAMLQLIEKGSLVGIEGLKDR